MHVVAELFKQLLIALPEPPFPFEVYDFVMWTLGMLFLSFPCLSIVMFTVSFSFFSLKKKKKKTYQGSVIKIIESYICDPS